MKHYSDDDLIQGLLKSDHDILKYIYKVCYSDVSRHILNNHGSALEVKEVVQDAVVIIYKKAVKNELSFSKSFTAYFFSVCKLLWLKRLRNKRYYDMAFDKLFDPLSERSEESLYKEGSYSTIEEVCPLLKEKEELFISHFRNLHDDCRNLLEMFFKNISLKEIARSLGFKNEDTAKSKKYFCKDTLIRSIRNDRRYAELTNISAKVNI